MTEAKKQMLIRIKYEISQMRKHCLQNGIQYKEISIRSGITPPNVWRFLSMKSSEPSVLTFFMIAEAIGYEIKIEI